MAVSRAAVAGGMARAGGDPVNTGSILADTIGNVLVPNAVNQILNAFPSLKTDVGSSMIDMALDVSFLDGPNNTLAYAQFTAEIILAATAVVVLGRLFKKLEAGK